MALFALLALRRGCRLLRRPESGRIGIGVFWRRSEKGHSCRGVFPVLLLLGVALCRQGKEE